MDTKKERRLAPPLRVEVLELRTGGLQILLGLSNSVRFLSTLPLGSGRGSSTPALFLDVFRSSDSTGLRPFPRRFPELALLSPIGSSGSRLPNSGLFRYRSSFLSLIVRSRSFPDLFRLSISVSCFQSVDLLRLAPPGVYLKGSRLPFESPFNGTTGFCRARSGRRTQYHVSTCPFSVTLRIAFRRVGRPAGGFL